MKNHKMTKLIDAIFIIALILIIFVSIIHKDITDIIFYNACLISYVLLIIKIKREGQKMKKKKVFISQPMRDKTDEEILVERERMIKIVKERYPDYEIEIIDSFFQNAPVEAKPLWYLGKSLEKLSEADVAVFAPMWDQYRGCRIEHLCAQEYNIEYINF